MRNKICYLFISYKVLKIKYFYSSRNFTDKGLINFGKSIQNLSGLNSISLNFY